MSRTKEWTIVFLAAQFVLFVALAGTVIELDFHLLFGWLLFLGRVVPKMRIDAGGFAVAAACLAVLALGGHRFLKSIYEQQTAGDVDSPIVARPWRAKWTAYLLILIVMMFTVGLSAVGVFHQIAWLATAPYR